MRHDLHVRTLKIYLKAGIAPRGLLLSLTPSMHTFNKRETQNWNETLKSASLQLTKIVVDHCDNTLASLRAEELRARNNIVLSALEASELELFEKKKTDEIMRIKIKKLSRDKVPYSNEFSQINSAPHHTDIVNPKITPLIRPSKSK